MANDDSQRAERGQRDEGNQQSNQQSNQQGGQQADGLGAGSDADAVREEQSEHRHGLEGRGFDAGTGYGGAGNTSAYSGESSYGGQAGYGGNTMRGAYDGGEFGRAEGSKTPDALDPSAGERGSDAKGGLEE